MQARDLQCPDPQWHYYVMGFKVIQPGYELAELIVLGTGMLRVLYRPVQVDSAL